MSSPYRLEIYVKDGVEKLFTVLHNDKASAGIHADRIRKEGYVRERNDGAETHYPAHRIRKVELYELES